MPAPAMALGNNNDRPASEHQSAGINSGDDHAVNVTCASEGLQSWLPCALFSLEFHAPRLLSPLLTFHPVSNA